MDVRGLCLGVLTFGDASGYEIKKTLETRFSTFFHASYGSIYPALTRLQEEGLLECQHESQNHRPDKKVYTLTVAGKLAFIESLSAPPEPDRIRSPFLVAMIFSELLPARKVAGYIEARLENLRATVQQLENLSCHDQSPGQQFSRGYGMAMLKCAIGYIEENRHLVEGEALLAQVKKDVRRQVPGETAAAE